MTMRIDILTTFPELFDPASPGGALNSSITARARAAGIVSWHAINIRSFADNKHDKTDDRPFGGGPGMVMSCQPVYDAVLATEALDPAPATRLFLTPQGKPLTQPIVESLAVKPRLLIIAGHYEGIDERVIRKLDPLELSLGDYVLSSGELAAIVLIDAVTRLLPGALGDECSANQDSFGIAESFVGTSQTPKRDRIAIPPGTRLLDCPHYTKPREWMGMSVPDVLLSGDHEAIARWRLQQRMERTKERRPELLRDNLLPNDSNS